MCSLCPSAPFALSPVGTFVINSRLDASVDSPGVAGFEQFIALFILAVMMGKDFLSGWWTQFAVSAVAFSGEIWLATRWWFPGQAN